MAMTKHDKRALKDQLYQQVAQLGKALASPKRLELIELLGQSEKTVEMLVEQTGINLKLTSAHLRELRSAHLVQTRREGKYVYYRLVTPAVSQLWCHMRQLAESQLDELQKLLKTLNLSSGETTANSRDELLRLAQHGEVVVLDVRPAEEYLAAHLPFARSIPLAELRRRLDELPKDRPIVAYCRGPYCLMAPDAVKFLQKAGLQARHLRDSVADWGIYPEPVSTV